MDRFDRGAKGKTEDTREVVKGGTKEDTAAAEREAAAEPPRTVANPLVDGDNSPGVSPIVDGGPEGPSPFLYPASAEDADNESDDEGSDETSTGDAAERSFSAEPAPASLLLPAVQAAHLDVLEDVVNAEPSGFPEPNDGGIAGRKAGGEQQEYDLDPPPSRLVGDEIVWRRSDDLDVSASVPTVPGLSGTGEGAAESLHGYGTVYGVPRDDAGVTRLVGDEVIPGFTVPDASGGGVNQMDNSIPGEFTTGDMTAELITDGDLDRGPVMLNTDEQQPVDPQANEITGFGSFETKLNSTDGDSVLEGAEPLEFIIGDGGSMFPNWVKSDEDDSGVGIPADLSPGMIDERSLEFKSMSGMDDERDVNQLTSEGDSSDVALGGPDTATRIDADVTGEVTGTDQNPEALGINKIPEILAFTTPDVQIPRAEGVPDVEEQSGSAWEAQLQPQSVESVEIGGDAGDSTASRHDEWPDALAGGYLAGVQDLSLEADAQLQPQSLDSPELNVDPLAYNQTETLASSLDDDDDDPLAGL